jgi:hypothetical protein
MKRKFGKLRQEIAKVLRWLLRNPSVLRLVLRVGFLIYSLLKHLDK